jgi:hypothetical protein
MTVCSCEDKYSRNILLYKILELVEINYTRSSCNHINLSLCQDRLYIYFNNSNTQHGKMRTHNVTTPHTLLFLSINEGVILHRKTHSFLVSWTCVIHTFTYSISHTQSPLPLTNHLIYLDPSDSSQKNES